MAKLRMTDEQLAKIYVDNCELKVPANSQADLAKELGVSRGYVCTIVKKLRANGTIDAYKAKLAAKPKVDLKDTKGRMEGIANLLQEFIDKAQKSGDNKELLAFIKPQIDLLGKMGAFDKPNAPIVNINLDQHLGFIIQMVMEYVPVEKHDEVKAKYEEYKKTIEVK